jgi:hypothetical protein
MHHHSLAHDGSGRTPRLRARHRTKGGLLRGRLRQVRRHPLASGAALAAVGWLLSGGNERHEPARVRRAARSQVSGAGSAINGEASHG